MATRWAALQRTAESRRLAPTPMIEVVMMCVGTPGGRT